MSAGQQLTVVVVIIAVAVILSRYFSGNEDVRTFIPKQIIDAMYQGGKDGETLRSVVINGDTYTISGEYPPVETSSITFGEFSFSEVLK